MNGNKFMLQGSKQVPSGSAGQVDFLAKQVTFKAHLPNKGQDNWSCNRIINREKQKVALTKQNMRAACPKDKHCISSIFYIPFSYESSQGSCS